MRKRSDSWNCAVLLAAFIAVTAGGEAAEKRITLNPDQVGKPISSELFGIFFEDLNYAADGGLYAELIQNRSFEYQATEQKEWNPLSYWDLEVYGNGEGSLNLDAGRPVHPNNKHYAVLDVKKVGSGVGIRNSGFDGIVLQKGSRYEFSCFVRQLYLDKRWDGRGFGADQDFTLFVRLEGPEGQSLGEAKFEYAGTNWQKVAGEIVASGETDNGRLVVFTRTQGGIALDMISLFPKNTFHGRKNGLRKDLAEAIAALEPSFVRFPGGCLVHGNGLGNMYHWKNTIGPIEERVEQANLWGYHQSVGLGYFEFFQFCEDIGAKPLPVVPAGVCCQNSGFTHYRGQDGLPLSMMAEYVQEVLDLIEYANGSPESEWGSRRAEAGHPEPFHLEYVGVGNEEHITPVFEERFRMIVSAIRAKHPEITVIGTVGPFSEGPDYVKGWRIADDMQLALVDEHYYHSPEWFLENLNRYDRYDRDKSKVYLGEYAAHEKDRQTTLRSALAEASYLTHLERNGDIVLFSSYAPLLGKRGHTQWNPNLIYFTNTRVCPTINYYVQKLFSTNAGDVYLEPAPGQIRPKDPNLPFSVVRDSKNKIVIVKVVNNSKQTQSLLLQLQGSSLLASQAEWLILTGEPTSVNSFEEANQLMPKEIQLQVANPLSIELPSNSLNVIRLKVK